jgi:hypothetical protein
VPVKEIIEEIEDESGYLEIFKVRSKRKREKTEEYL